jgi:hypothetical protein
MMPTRREQLCPECGDFFKGQRCRCGYDLTPAKASPEKIMWIVRECSTPDCHVMIRAPHNNLGPDTCKWCDMKARGEW